MWTTWRYDKNVLCYTFLNLWHLQIYCESNGEYMTCISERIAEWVENVSWYGITHVY